LDVHKKTIRYCVRQRCETARRDISCDHGPAYFREAAEIIGAFSGPPDRAKMMEISHRHGMAVAASPPDK
jgi:hypothetical protein